MLDIINSETQPKSAPNVFPQEKPTSFSISQNVPMLDWRDFLVMQVPLPVSMIQLPKPPLTVAYPAREVLFEPVTRRDNVAEAWDKVYQRLNEIAKLPRNWDSYDGNSPTPVSIATATMLLQKISHKHSLRGIPFTIVPLASGGVQIEWRSALRAIEVEIGPEGDFGYLLIKGNGLDREFDEKDGALEVEVVALISSVVS